MKYKKIHLGLFILLILFFNVPIESLKEPSKLPSNPNSSSTFSNEIQLEWRTFYGGVEDEYGMDMVQDTEGFIYVVGRTESYGSGARDGYLLKYDSTGEIIWERLWGGTGYDSFDALIINDTEIYIAATRSGIIHLVKYNTSGVLLWSSAGGYGSAYCIGMDSEGNIYVGGNRDVGGSDEYQFYLVKFNNTGFVEWSKTWGTSRDYEACNGIAIDSSDNVYIVGNSRPWSNADTFIYSAKINSTGNIKWEHFWGGIILDYGYGIGIDKFDNIFIVGGTGTYAVESRAIVLIKYNDNGDELWYRTYEFGYNAFAGQDIIIADTGNMYLLGYDTYLEVNSSGGLLYSKHLGTQLYRALEMDDNGNIFFIGTLRSGDRQSCFEKWVRTPEIEILSPSPYQTFGNATFEFELSFHMSDINTTWYSLNFGVNQTFNGIKGLLNQDLWNLCDNGSVIITFYANNSKGELAYNEIVVLKDIYLNDIIIYSPIPLQEFGRDSPYFEVYVPFSDTDSIWYTLNNGPIYQCGLNGTIEQSEWNSFNNGQINIRFYANNSESTIISNSIIVNKNVILTPKNVYAVVIGIENYPGTDNDLSFCRDDANGMYNYLRFECNVKEENIIRLLDSSASFNGISSALQQIRSKIKSSDVLVFYFSGHGGNDGGSTEFICPYDSIPSNPSSLLYDWILDMELDAINCVEKYIIIDACNSGGMIPEVQGAGRYFMTACRDYEDSIETFDLRNGVFTNFFLDSSQYASDLNFDGILSMEEQFPYVYDETVSYAIGVGHNQHPVENDGIPGPAVLYPGINSVTLIPQNNFLSYSFNIFGSGSIVTLNISICSVNPSIITKTVDLIGQSSSSTGFGSHSGIISLENGYNITGYEVLIQIDGYNLKTFKYDYGDTDGDNLTDLFEIKVSKTNPILNDTDSDGLNDYYEFYGITDPTLNDTDNDGLLDGEEINIFSTNPLSNDTDSDNLSDYNEIYSFFTNPLIDDTDADGLLDGEEINTFTTNPLSNDTDADGLLDGAEINIYNTNPLNEDSDSDTMLDGWEVDCSLNPLVDDTMLDPDSDDLANIFEYQQNTDPQNPDTDFDGWTDGDEVLVYLTDPLDPQDHPTPSTPTPPTPPPTAIPGYHIIVLISIVGGISLILIKKKLNQLK